jgi:thioredoxin reductase/bacterioferritin-associated ferredoxin
MHDTGGKADLLVIGAGPAGASAALAAAAHGLDVHLVDEAAEAGGQVWRALPMEFTVKAAKKLGPEAQLGNALRDKVRASTIRTSFGHRVWTLRHGFAAEAVGPNGNELFTAQALVLAPGTTERISPFPGHTLPGIVGLGAATVLLKSQQMLPGRRTLVAGAGPLLLAVATAILKGGGEVAAIVDLNSRAQWLQSFSAAMQRPDLLWRGLEWHALLRAHRVPYLWRHAVRSASGGAAVAKIAVGPVDASGYPEAGRDITFNVDALAIGNGLIPSTEMTRLLGADHIYDQDYEEWVARLDDVGRSSIQHLYVAGDSAGISGAAAAVIAGEIAGITAAFDQGRISAKLYQEALALRTPRLRRARRFGRAMARLMKVPAGLYRAISADTIICRCEDVTRRAIDEAVKSGATRIGQLKAWTRCGMGPCQGRNCCDSAGRLMELNGISRQEFGQMAGRAPFRPVPIEAIAGDFTYDDIALPLSLPSS